MLDSIAQQRDGDLPACLASKATTKDLQDLRLNNIQAFIKISAVFDKGDAVSRTQPSVKQRMRFMMVFSDADAWGYPH